MNNNSSPRAAIDSGNFLLQYATDKVMEQVITDTRQLSPY